MSIPPPEQPDKKGRDSAIIVHPEPAAKSRKLSRKTRDLVSILSEAEGLAHAIDLEIADILSFNVSRIQPDAYLGKGQREQVGGRIAELLPDIVIVNCALSPVQQRNLEKEWNCKVIDRTGLILEIFGARAQTREGKLQVELAALDYQRSRLVRSWTHLERQRGGAGFMGGPGETQIELDRRIISERINKLKKDLKDVRRTRELGRKGRERVPFPVVSLVGYTNAGKSTLFNHITKADVFAKDLLFATLDPTMRRVMLPNHQMTVLSDTVGFISELPTHLIEAFRATLEQITQADAIIHVIDVSRPDYLAQKQDVIRILTDLGVEYEKDQRIIEAWNKIDLLDEDARQDFRRKSNFTGNAAEISALTGQGIDQLLELAAKIVSRGRRAAEYVIPVTDGKALAWLYAHGEVKSREDSENHVSVHVMMDQADISRFLEHYGYEAQNSDRHE